MHPSELLGGHATASTLVGDSIALACALKRRVTGSCGTSRPAGSTVSALSWYRFLVRVFVSRQSFTSRYRFHVFLRSPFFRALSSEPVASESLRTPMSDRGPSDPHPNPPNGTNPNTAEKPGSNPGCCFLREDSAISRREIDEIAIERWPSRRGVGSSKLTRACVSPPRRERQPRASMVTPEPFEYSLVSAFVPPGVARWTSGPRDLDGEYFEGRTKSLANILDGMQRMRSPDKSVTSDTVTAERNGRRLG
jgi:hypothetical protein